MLPTDQVSLEKFGGKAYIARSIDSNTKPLVIQGTAKALYLYRVFSEILFDHENIRSFNSRESGVTNAHGFLESSCDVELAR